MDPIILQIFIVLFVLFVSSRVILRFQDGQMSFGELLFWSLVWGAVLIVAFLPDILSKMSQKIGISRGLDLVLPLGLVLVFYLVFRAYIKIEQVEQDVTKLSRMIALRDIKKGKKK